MAGETTGGIRRPWRVWVHLPASGWRIDRTCATRERAEASASNDNRWFGRLGRTYVVRHRDEGDPQ